LHVHHVLLQVFLSATLSNAREFSEWVVHPTPRHLALCLFSSRVIVLH
jgi:superfamily II RNA helicase